MWFQFCNLRLQNAEASARRSGMGGRSWGQCVLSCFPVGGDIGEIIVHPLPNVKHKMRTSITRRSPPWIPAFAGMTGGGGARRGQSARRSSSAGAGAVSAIAASAMRPAFWRTARSIATATSGFSVVLAAWASGNRVSIFAGMRSVAMLISYEIPMALSLVGVLMLAGSMSLVAIVDAQDIPFFIVQPIGVFVFLVAVQAETGRTPFDLIEAESELAAGYLNDYSSMKFGIFFLAEFLATIAAAMIIVTLFFGGWRGFAPIPPIVWFAGKTLLVLLFIMWFRLSWPRLRVDQILALAWKGLFELTLINIFVTGILIAIWPQPTYSQLWIMAGINWVAFFISIWAVAKLLGTREYKEDEGIGAAADYPVAVNELATDSNAGSRGAM